MPVKTPILHRDPLSRSFPLLSTGFYSPFPSPIRLHLSRVSSTLQSAPELLFQPDGLAQLASARLEWKAKFTSWISQRYLGEWMKFTSWRTLRSLSSMLLTSPTSSLVQIKFTISFRNRSPSSYYCVFGCFFSNVCMCHLTASYEHLSRMMPSSLAEEEDLERLVRSLAWISIKR